MAIIIQTVIIPVSMRVGFRAIVLKYCLNASSVRSGSGIPGVSTNKTC